MYNPYYTAIGSGVDNAIPEADLKNGQRRYYYVDNPAAPYQGYVQNSMMIFSPKSVKQTAMARFELSRKGDSHHWMVGFHNWFYDADKVGAATYSYQFEVAPNPKSLGYDQWVMSLDENKKPIPGTGKWVTKTDAYGNSSYNNAMQYYDGMDNKMALVATDKWTASDKFIVNAGTRLEWQHIDGYWYNDEDRKAAGTNWVSGETSKVSKNWWNASVTANMTYKAFENAGFLADGYYIQQAGKLSAYAGADDPNIDTSVIPGLSAGIYYNHPLVSLVSKFTTIKRTNFKNNSTFNNPETGAVDKKTISYDVNTIGWTTDVLLTLFKGFNLHFLLTLQNPKYENYAFTTSWGQEVNNSGNVARSVSKTIMEIDPSYKFGKFRLWGSARYFSKEYANYPNTLVFASRWKTFAGIDFKYDKNIDFSISAVNLLNQSGAQGSISGTNTTNAEQAVALYDKPLSGTYIRPFTVELKTKIRF